MEAYKPYVDYIMASGVAETAYILSKDGVVCGTSLPIKELPKYNFEYEDEKNVKHQVVVDERVNLLEAIANKGVTKSPVGIRLYNQKYYSTHTDTSKEGVKIFYLKKTKGGACVCVTNKFILIGTFNTEAKMHNGVPQNPGELNKRVEELAKNLIGQGS